MFWFCVWQVVSTLIELIRLGRRSESDKDFEILLLRRQLAIYERRQERAPQLSRGEKLTLIVLGTKLKEQTGRTIKAMSEVIRIVKPATLFGWHRALVRRKWAIGCKNQSQGEITVPATFVIQANLRHCVVMEEDASGPASISFSPSVLTDIDPRLRDKPTDVCLETVRGLKKMKCVRRSLVSTTTTIARPNWQKRHDFNSLRPQLTYLRTIVDGLSPGQCFFIPQSIQLSRHIFESENFAWVYLDLQIENGRFATE